MMKKLIIPVLLTIFMTACSNPPKDAQNRVDAADVLAANQNAALMFQNAENYAAQCMSMGVTIKAGRYDGKLGTGATSCSYTGDKADFEAAQNTFTNGMVRGYYSVTIGTDGRPTVAYWSEAADLSREEFPPSNESYTVTADKVIGRHPNGAELARE